MEDSNNYVFTAAMLHKACEMDNLEKIKSLIADGADVDVYSSIFGHRGTPLHTASGQGHLETIKLLIENGADIHRKNKYGLTALRVLFQSAKCKAAKLFLIENGADVNVTDNDGKTALHEACERDVVENFKLLVEHGADVNARDNSGETPLHRACGYRNYGGIESENMTFGDADTDFEDHLETIKLLMENGADLNVQNNRRGEAPLHMACWYNHVEVVKVLLSRGANVNIERTDGVTPLDIATNKNHLEIVWLLVRQDPSAVLERMDQILEQGDNVEILFDEEEGDY